MRVVRTEKGNIYGKDYIKPYVRVYIQPWHNYAVAWLYHHVWEKLTGRIWKVAENLRNKWPKKEPFYIPYTNRQDIRCYNLQYKGQVELSKEFGEPRPRTPTKRLLP